MQKLIVFFIAYSFMAISVYGCTTSKTPDTTTVTTITTHDVEVGSPLPVKEGEEIWLHTNKNINVDVYDEATHTRGVSTTELHIHVVDTNLVKVSGYLITVVEDSTRSYVTDTTENNLVEVNLEDIYFIEKSTQSTKVEHKEDVSERLL